ncbi:class F sortase [Streptomyces globisporus]|uniref:class F sortase n=1 Tax=Streptomyces TaxID=1883 RepID=UPI0004C7DC96|nr:MULTISPECIES: class F sortase [Streptomyces]WSF78865.1 class F sortase [Streptomyces globisporus]RDL02711.1 sortase family protein [Streptomyces sp. HB202]WSQ93919.1 class F sortase [Streptomyces globisporus]WSV91886.1 class F sortase [Streptomyces globisporus]GGW11793.1 class F sortase [Streptomyces globisporus]
MGAPDRPAGNGRLLTGVTWAVLLLGLWLWGKEAGGGFGGLSGPTTGDVAAVGRPFGASLPPAHDPLDGSAPERVEVPSVGIDAPVIARGLDPDGAIDPPPYGMPKTAGWYGDGTRPGAEGAALFVGHVDTDTKPAVFYGLSAVKPGARIEVTRTDGSVAEFTVDDVQLVTRERFDAQQAYGPREDGRAELRLITCGGTYDHKTRSYTANVVVSAYLTGAKGAAAGDGEERAQAVAQGRG